MPTTQEKITAVCKKQVDACLQFRQPRMDEIKRSEDACFGKTKPALIGRFNIPIPIVEGFVETLMSKIDDEIKITFKKGREATLKAAKKVSAAWEKDSAPDRGAYDEANLDSKKLAIFSGFGTLKLIPQSNPYMQELVAVDYADLLFEPYGGRDLDKHIFKGEMNIMLSKETLIAGAKSKRYNANQVKILLAGVSDSEQKKTMDQNEAKEKRFASMGLVPKNYSYVGTNIYNLTEMVTKDPDGNDYYVLFHYPSLTWIRVEKLEDVFPKGLSPFVSWQVQRNPASFLSRGPIDAIRPVGEAMRELLNQNFTNIQKRNFDQVLFNSRKILNPAQLKYRPNGLVSVKLKDGESMRSAYEKMETPDTTTITINLLAWLESFIGQKTGVTPGAQGVSEEEKATIYLGNMQAIADRYGMQNKFYTMAHQKIGVRYKANLAEFMPPRKFMVRFIGLKGIQDEELTKEEAGSELDVQVVSSISEAKNSVENQAKKERALDRILTKPELYQQSNPKWVYEEVLRNGGYKEDTIRYASDKEGGNAELLSEAAQSIEKIVNGEKAEMNRGANLSFVKKIKEYARDNQDDMDDEIFVALMEYALAHLPFAEQNEIEQQVFEQRQLLKEQAMMGNQPLPVKPVPTEQPI